MSMELASPSLPGKASDSVQLNGKYPVGHTSALLPSISLSLNTLYISVFSLLLFCPLSLTHPHPTPIQQHPWPTPHPPLCPPSPPTAHTAPTSEVQVLAQQAAELTALHTQLGQLKAIGQPSPLGSHGPCSSLNPSHALYSTRSSQQSWGGCPCHVGQ